MNLKEKKVLVFGAGLSGIGACGLLANQGTEIILFDGNAKCDAESLRKQISDQYPVQIVLGAMSAPILDGVDLVILSPGVPTDLPEVKEIRRRGIPVWGEVELAYVCSRGTVLGITGTNGKTTTTALLGEIIKAYKDSVFVVGNIGTPYTKAALQTTEDSVVVAELSSFQLETIHEFHPHVSAILNISPDHLDRHHTMAQYIAAKENITRNQTAEDTCILNYEDEETVNLSKKIRADVLYFSSARKLNKGIYLEDGKIIYKDQEEILICNTCDLNILGRHNYENVMAAVLMALVYGVPVDVIRKAVLNFKGVAHRIEYVREYHGVKYYNDSKGTNPDAAIRGLEAMKRPTILIGGGYDKEASYQDWIACFEGRVKKLILLGETREAIAKEAKASGFYDVILVDTLEDAVSECAREAVSGDAVLLSPACASWGMFRNFEERGDKFKELVNSL